MRKTNILYITAVHMAGGTGHQHIADVEYKGLSGSSDRTTTADMVRWVRSAENEARVTDTQSPGYVLVGVVNATPPYLRTHRDGTVTDNLLHLPRY